MIINPLYGQERLEVKGKTFRLFYFTDGTYQQYS